MCRVFLRFTSAGSARPTEFAVGCSRFESGKGQVDGLGARANLASPGARSLLSRGALWSVSRTPLGRILAHLHASPNQILQLNLLREMGKGLQNLYAWVRLPPAPPFRINSLQDALGNPVRVSFLYSPTAQACFQFVS